MLKNSLILLFIVISANLFSQAPKGYYNSIDGKQNRELKTSLSKILKNHTVLQYSNLWYYFRTTDVRDDGLTIWDMYSDEVRQFNPVEGKSTPDVQREHSLPKSWWGTAKESEKQAAYTDLNHLYPSDGAANQAKSNYMLGEVGSNFSFNNGVSKVGKNTYNYPGASKARAFEPADEYKGDFARTYFYMITCYEDYADQWRSDALQMFNNETYPVLKPWAQSMLLKWHREDPVSEKEWMRNEEVYIYQNNRNPFIDFPDLAEYIWGNKTDKSFKVPANLISKEPTLISPANLSEVFLGKIRKNTLIKETILLKGINLTGNLTIKLKGTNTQYFTISATKIPAKYINSENGYALTISYHPTKKGNHKALIQIQGAGMKEDVVVHINGICQD